MGSLNFTTDKIVSSTRSEVQVGGQEPQSVTGSEVRGRYDWVLGRRLIPWTTEEARTLQHGTQYGTDVGRTVRQNPVSEGVVMS